MKTISRREFIDMVAERSGNIYPKVDLYYIIRDTFWCLEDILRDGHIDYSVKMAVKLGLDPIRAIKMATINTAKCYGLKHLGAISPGFQADFVVLDNLTDLNVTDVFYKGKLAATC